MATPKKRPPARARAAGPSQRRYPAEMKERAVRMVAELRREDPGDRA